MWQIRLAVIAILVAGLGIGYFVFASEKNASFPFKLGLDLQGGTHLVYRADISEIPSEDVIPSMNALRDVIERRVNLFGVSEPIVQIEQSGVFSGVSEERLVVELPGVTDIDEAVRLIGETPLLEFKLLKEEQSLTPDASGEVIVDEIFEPTGLTGRFLERAQLTFGSSQAGGLSNEPIVLLEFTSEGGDLFAKITKENVGRVLAIFLDGGAISTPVIREEIPSGQATISGNFEPNEARDLVKNLNFGALPVPIELISTQTIGATLGDEAVSRGVQAGFIGLLLVMAFMILWYRLPGILSVLSLGIYLAAMLALFKLIPVTLTSAGVAGFILSIGIAVDANVIIFERLKEELRGGSDLENSVKQGFARAWFSIRDGNLSSIITAIILFWFGSFLIEGFALTFGVGVLVSMLTAIIITRTFLKIFGNPTHRGVTKFIFGSGIK
jgi:protein-export membrane protein SecD|tara:strand:- start:894 stop:2219 length:1326 start_codon:yes stop_codon:yes gene_type:complete